MTFLMVPKSMSLNDLEPLKYGFFSEFFSQFEAATHISRVNRAESTGDRPRQHAYEIFSIKRRFQWCKFHPL